MAKNKDLDNISIAMIECEKAGFGCHYGKWYAATRPAKIEQKQKPIPDGWLICEHCGKPFTQKTKKKKRYCDEFCRNASYYERNKDRRNAKARERRLKKHEQAENVRDE